ncbi:MAG TPA: hypothetical protein VJP78_14575 [Thermoleophilia bacterium]|nr:hypothetical protein [Thermoleophilia bacterium]
MGRQREDTYIKRHLIWIIPLILIVLLVAPSPVAERYTSSTQDGQFIVHPIRSYGFVITLARTSGSAVLSNPGEALEEAKKVFVDSGSRPVRVALLYIPARDTYTYVRKTGEALTIVAPPKLVWEVWARATASSSPQTTTTDVIGFLDYASGRRIGFGDRFADRLPAGAATRADSEPFTPFGSRP